MTFDFDAQRNRNRYMILELERVARLAYPEHAATLTVLSQRTAKKAVGLSQKCVVSDDTRGAKILARGDSYRGMARDLAKLCKAKGVNPKRAPRKEGRL